MTDTGMDDDSMRELYAKLNAAQDEVASLKAKNQEAKEQSMVSPRSISREKWAGTWSLDAACGKPCMLFKPLARWKTKHMRSTQVLETKVRREQEQKEALIEDKANLRKQLEETKQLLIQVRVFFPMP
jgi:hypothetical protein